MKTIDLSPLYRSTVGYDRLASLLDSTLRSRRTVTHTHTHTHTRVHYTYNPVSALYS